jgi:hypothetical protein
MDRLAYDTALFVQQCRLVARFNTITQAQAITAFWVACYPGKPYLQRLAPHIPLEELDAEVWADEEGFIRDTLAAHGIRIVAN